MIVYFSEFFLYVVIIGSLLFSCVAVVTLVSFLIRDKKNKEVW